VFRQRRAGAVLLSRGRPVGQGERGICLQPESGTLIRVRTPDSWPRLTGPQSPDDHTPRHGPARRRQGPAPPAVPLRAGHARLGPAGCPGHRGRHLRARHRGGQAPVGRDRPGRHLRGLRRGRAALEAGGRLRRGVHLPRGAQLAARRPPLGRGGCQLPAPGWLLLHRRGPPVRLGLRRRRHGHRAQPPLPPLAVPGAAGVPQRRLLRRPRRPRERAVRVRLAAQHGRDHHLAGRGRAAYPVPARASLGAVDDVPFMAETEPGSGVWRLPAPDDARLPLLFSLKATKP
jgi:hypothetical protein